MLLTWIDSRPTALYSLVSGSWLAWADDTMALYAAIYCPQWRTFGPTMQHDRYITVPVIVDMPPPQSATLGLYPIARKLPWHPKWIKTEPWEGDVHEPHCWLLWSIWVMSWESEIRDYTVEWLICDCCILSCYWHNCCVFSVPWKDQCSVEWLQGEDQSAGLFMLYLSII